MHHTLNNSIISAASQVSNAITTASSQVSGSIGGLYSSARTIGNYYPNNTIRVGNMTIDGNTGTITFIDTEGNISKLDINDSGKLKRIVNELREYWPEAITDLVLKGLI